MDVSRYVPATFVVADTDHLSEARAEDTLLNTAWASHRDHCRFWRVPRAREVGQSWLSTIGTTALACAHAFGIITTVRPELILVNGPVRLPIRPFQTQSAAVCCQFYLRVSSLGASTSTGDVHSTLRRCICLRGARAAGPRANCICRVVLSCRPPVDDRKDFARNENDRSISGAVGRACRETRQQSRVHWQAGMMMSDSSCQPIDKLQAV